MADKVWRLLLTRNGRKVLEAPEPAGLAKHVEVNFPRAHETNDPDVRLISPDGTQHVFNAESGWSTGKYSTEEGWQPDENQPENAAPGAAAPGATADTVPARSEPGTTATLEFPDNKNGDKK